MTDSSLARRIARVSRLTGKFMLRSGATSDHYFDKYAFEADPALLRDICAAMTSLIPEGTDVLVGMELGGVPIASVLSQQTGIPLALARKEAKTYGTCKQIEGADLSGKTVLIVEDVISTGGAVADAVVAIRAAGAKVTHALCVINRSEGTPDSLTGKGITLSWLLSESEIPAS